jgi:WD40 repeat protein
MFRDAARAVQHLHDMGIVHRDLKPGNLMLTADQRRVVVMDLGLAALGDASRALTRESGAILGTLRYMPPEQLRRDGGAVDPRVDVYALGATFYELLTGRPLFSTDSEAQLLDQVLNRAPVPPRDATPALPRDLCTIVEKCLSKEARARYSSAAALADDLDAFLEGRAIAARAPTLGYVLLLAAKRHRAVTLTAALASLTLVAVLAHFMRQEHTLRHDAVEARHNADEKQIEARDRLGDFLTEQARVELVDRGDAGRALAYLHAARKHGYESPTHAFLLSEALRAVEKDVIPLEGGAARIDKLVFDQKGATLAGATDEGVIHTWDATTGQRILSFQGSHGRVKDLAFADEGLALVYDDGFAEYRDEFARSIPVSRDGQRVVAHEFASGRPAFVFADGSARELGDSFVHDDATQPLRRLIPQASARVALLSDGHVRLWFADKTTTLRTDDPSLRDVAHAGGDKVVTLSEDGTVTLWDVRATRRLTVFSASGAPTRLVVTPSSDETIQVEARGAAWYTYSIARGGPGRDWTSKLEAARPAEPPAADRFLQTGRLEMDGRVVRATRDGGAELIRDKVRRTHVVDGRQQAPVAFSSCGRYLAIVDGIGVGSLRDATTGRPIRSVEGMLAKRDAFSPDGDRLVTEWGTVESTRTGKVVAKLQGAPSPSASSSSLGGRGLGHVSFDGVGKRVVGVSDDADAQVWDASTGERIATLPGSKGAPAIALSADGTMVLACGGRRATIWDATTGAVRAVLRGHDDPVFDCSFSRTGERAVTASLDGMARIWDTRTGAVLRRVEHKIKSLSAARFGPDGKVLVTTTLDGDAALWHVDTGEKVATMVGDGHPLSEPRFSRDGNYLLLAKWSVREARVFDGHRGTLLTTLSDAESKHAADKFPGGYWAADISPEGDRVVTSTIVTNRVLLWDLRVNVSSKERVEAVLASAVPWRVEVAGPGRTTPRDAPAPASSP